MINENLLQRTTYKIKCLKSQVCELGGANIKKMEKSQKLQRSEIFKEPATLPYELGPSINIQKNPIFI